MRSLLALWTISLAAAAAHAGFTVEDNGSAFTIRENDLPVATYNYGEVKPEGRLRASFARACYLHPVYDLNGDVITDDFPADHLHHRGIFWAWPQAESGGKEMDVWTLKGGRQRFEGVDVNEAGDKATLAVRNVWSFDDKPEEPRLREHVRLVFHPATAASRSIYFELHLENVSSVDFTLGGQMDSDKGYGGLCIRPLGGGSSVQFGDDESRSPFRFIAKEGIIGKDRFLVESPWVALLLPEQEDKPRSGVLMVQSPENPGYPHPGWILRHYGFLGQSWPHTQPHRLAPGASVVLRYRVVITKGLTTPEEFAQAASTP